MYVHAHIHVHVHAVYSSDSAISGQGPSWVMMSVRRVCVVETTSTLKS
jgi:hypothetical protein